MSCNFLTMQRQNIDSFSQEIPGLNRSQEIFYPVGKLLLNMSFVRQKLNLA